MKKLQVDQKIKNIIDKSSNILVIASRPIDLDGLASAIIIRDFFEKQKKTVRVLAPDHVPHFLLEFPEIRSIEMLDPQNMMMERYDIVVAIDGGNTRQFAIVNSDDEFNFNDNSNVLNIDHHSGSSHFGDYEIYYPDCSSTVEVILRTLVDPMKLSKEQSTLAYAGVMSDTGNLSHNFTSETLKLLSVLMENGAEKEFVFNRLENSYSKEAYLVMAELIQKTLFHPEVKFSFVEVDYNKLKEKYECSTDKIHEASSLYKDKFANSIGGFTISAVVHNYGKRKTVSLRGDNYNNQIPLTDIGRKLGKDKSGGGHFNAAGFSPKDSVKTNVEVSIVNFLKNNWDNYYK